MKLVWILLLSAGMLFATGSARANVAKGKGKAFGKGLGQIGAAHHAHKKPKVQGKDDDAARKKHKHRHLGERLGKKFDDDDDDDNAVAPPRKRHKKHHHHFLAGVGQVAWLNQNQGNLQNVGAGLGNIKNRKKNANNNGKQVVAKAPVVVAKAPKAPAQLPKGRDLDDRRRHHHHHHHGFHGGLAKAGGDWDDRGPGRGPKGKEKPRVAANVKPGIMPPKGPHFNGKVPGGKPGRGKKR